MKKLITVFASTLLFITVFSQTAPNKYWVQFVDKNDSPYTIDDPIEFLSQDAIDRREAQDIDVIEQDIPVNQTYIDQVLDLGAIDLLLKSKWFNSITIYTEDESLIEQIELLSIVSQVKSLDIYKKGKYEVEETPAIEKEYDPADYGFSFGQLEEINGDALHEADYLGEGVLIFVCDGGFTNLDNVDAFNHLFNDDRIIGTRDFVDGDDFVYQGSTHGTSVMGTMAGIIPNELKGTGPSASYFLARTEDTGSEYEIEEDNWIAAAELADSIGADIITTSLSYTTFDDTSLNHSYEDLDGQTTRIAIGAGIAAQKGMLIVVSAGNYFLQTWHYIGSPADAFNILAVGGITSDSSHSSFSSSGPSADGRVKPDIAARGTAAATANSGNAGVSFVNGTSFSAPIIAGISSCLWQAFPSATSLELREAIIQSAHIYTSPDDLFGYGIPDYGLAMDYLQDFLGVPPLQKPVNGIIQNVYPNPFTDQITISLKAPADTSDEGQITIYNSNGKMVYQANVLLHGSIPQKIIVSTLNLSSGVYHLEYKGKHSKETVKLVHL
jgi:subtilisin family serine protease